MSDAPQSGDIWEYPYLWAWQWEQGETEGRKSRPVAVAVAVSDANGVVTVYLLAITSKEPSGDRPAIEIPETERRRANLSRDRRLWIVLDEYNSDVYGDSFYLGKDALRGCLGEAFLRQVQRRFREVVAAGGSKGVNRRND